MIQEILAMSDEKRPADGQSEISVKRNQSLDEELRNVNRRLRARVRELEASNQELLGLLGRTDIAKSRRAEAVSRANRQLEAETDKRTPTQADRAGLRERVESDSTLLKTVLRQLPTGVVIAEAPSGRLLMGNDQVEQILGHGFIACETIQEWDVYTGFHPDGREYRPEEWPLARAVKAGEVVEGEEIEFPRGDGSTGVMRVSAAPVRDPEGNVTAGVVIFDDITERKLNERRARQHEAELAHVSRLSALGAMVTGIAHEITQPLTAIVTYAESCLHMLRSGQADPDRIRENIEAVAAQGLRTGEIIRGLKRLARKEEPARTLTDINELVRKVVGLILPEARERGVDVRLMLCESLPSVRVEPVQVEQVVLNLMRNGIESINCADAGARIMTVETANGSGAVQVSVSDTGPGLGGATRAEIFNPFFTTKRDGMGLGLSISRSIIEAHGGRLEVDTACSSGVRFYFDLPAAAEGDVS